MNVVRNAGLVLAVAVAAMAAPVLAHPKLLSSTPAADATAGNVKEISLKFSEALMGPVSGADLMMDMKGMEPMKMTGLKTSVGKDGKTLVATLDKPLPAGHYSLNWHVVSTDTHRVAGKLAFTVK
ncbi:MAG: copper homeostasis periplasmic binding protein CopC [Sphingobium sp.]|nr:copper homeostasis periplasmic binding protein CopC [Sphingobium sp.]